MRIIAAVLPTALVIEKMRKTVSIVAGLPGAALTLGARPQHASCVTHHADEKGDVLVGDGLADDSVEIGHMCLREERCAPNRRHRWDGKR
jgi:hypothetical protein